MKKLVAVLMVLFIVASCLCMAGAVAAKGPQGEDRHAHGIQVSDDGLTVIEDFRTGQRGAVRIEGIAAAQANNLSSLDELGIFQLTNVSPHGCFHPMFCPDRTKIAYMTHNSTGPHRAIWVMVLDFSLGRLEVVDNYPVTDPDVQCAHLEGWSPDGTKILFRSYVDSYGLWIAHADGSGVEQLLDAGSYCLGSAGTLYQASYSPDGSEILFKWALNNITDSWAGNIYVMDADGTNVRQLTNYTGNFSVHVGECAKSPRWSPDGTKIAYRRCDLNHTSDLMVMDANGANQQIVAAGVNAQIFDWSPDGQWIVYEWENETHDSGRDIYQVRPDGSGNKRLTPSDDYCEHFPSWGPDGTILYWSDELENETEMSSMWVMNPDGSALTMINPWGGKWHDWSPTGEWIAFQRGLSSADEEYEQIYVMRNPLYRRPVPTLMPAGILALLALLSVIATISIVRKNERERR